MLSGIMFPADMLPKVFQGIAKILPATWGYEMMNSNNMELKTIVPLIIIMAVAICINAWRLLKIKID